MNILKALPFAVLMTISTFAFSQGTAINSTGVAPDASAGLDVDFSNKGMLAPRLTDAQRNAIVNPAEGLYIFNLTSGCFNYFHAGAWFQWCGSCIPPASPVVGGNGPICSGSSILLTASTIAGASYSWSGPNGFSSTIQNPTIANATTAASGIYSATVTLGGCTSVPATVNVVVNQTPVSSFTVAPNPGSINQNVTFTPTFTGGSYLWKFQSGTPATSTAQNPVVQWAVTGTFTTSLVVSANGCTSDTTYYPVTITNCPHGSQVFSYTGSIVTWTVPATCALVTIEAKGGEGGQNYFNDRITGKGAIIKGDFSLTGGQQLRIIVGQKGLTGVSNPYGAGSGGGASCVSVVGSSTPLIVAGGGGGCGGRQSTYYDGGPAQTGNTGGSAYPSGPSAGGTGGNGGNGGIGHQHCGAAGGGWYTAGGNTISDAACGSALNGTAAGGAGGSYGNTGGFGGGGGSNIAGGGGGGYSGGAGGDQTSGWNEWGGGGGGSFNSGANQSNTVGNTGNGSITITW